MYDNDVADRYIILIFSEALPGYCNVVIPMDLTLKCDDVNVSPSDEVKILVHQSAPNKPVLLINKKYVKKIGKPKLSYFVSENNMDQMFYRLDFVI